MRPPNTNAERAVLETERIELMDDIEKTKILLQEEVKAEADEGDPGLFDREMYRALLTTLEKKLESVNAALRAIERGRYGTCERCGEQIDPARLSAKPDAVLCLDCQLQVERLTKKAALRSMMMEEE
ncbi:MAG: TraR/DksA family transcriptional regulator [Anaerolineae bacterium]|nr:TraR/DksA family transcriptional regulator [Anaerolineae bacterium]MCB9129807.1 TraR/DksA family transcriptional regulator [Anaerolineales bacterium]MCB0228558.1 TraR/DksA family transcriptional regulator [Anaerolineae bacterium]MCB0234637.1 TraR/DksA family transcriptional regulator [Anaerolineae bacterium]MCB0237324.1 TraR/DksA family transcriptional regulator [Anaerolineae bacterium]